MTRGIKIRLIAFVVLSAVGLVYISASYLGFVDRILGRGYTMHVTLPESGGLFVGSEVTIRGVKVGNVSAMKVDGRGVRLDLAMKDRAEVPMSSAVYVHNLSAVGEQYLDFEPPSEEGPYAGEGDTIEGSEASMPVAEEDLLVQLDTFVNSVDKENLSTTILELGTMFRDTGRPIQTLLDNGGRFVEEAQAKQEQTLRLLDKSLVVLRTQQEQGENIRSLARDLNQVTATLRASDGDLRTILDEGRPAIREIDAMLKQLEPTLPVMLSNLVTVNQVVTVRLSALEQLLVTFPVVVSSGFTGTPGDGYGYINLQFEDSPQPCRKGYLTPDKWRSPSDLTDAKPFLAARCAEPPPSNMRGTKYAPSFGGGGAASPRTYDLAQYDPATGAVLGADGRPAFLVGDQGGLRDLFGDDAWKWLLIGPVRQG